MSRLGVEPRPPAAEGRFLTAGPPGTSLVMLFSVTEFVAVRCGSILLTPPFRRL